MNEEILEGKYCVVTLYGDRETFKRSFLYCGNKKELKLSNETIEIDAKNILKEQGYPLVWCPPLNVLREGTFETNSIRKYVFIKSIDIKEFIEKVNAEICYMFL